MRGFSLREESRNGILTVNQMATTDKDKRIEELEVDNTPKK